MKRFLLVIIASALLMSGCNNSEFDNRSSTIPPSSESETQTTGQSSAEIVVSEPTSGLSSTSQHTSANEPMISENTSSDTPSSITVQSSVSLSSSSSKPVASSTSENIVSTSESKPQSTISTTSTVSSSSTIKLPQSSSTVSSSIKIPDPPANKEENTLSITITANGRKFSATLYDSEAAKAFKSRLPLTLDMSELNGNEKYYYLSDSLPTNWSRPSRINTGDIMLYGSSCLVIFYESFSTSYSYTPIGKIDDPAGLAAALGSGSVQVAFNAAPNN